MIIAHKNLSFENILCCKLNVKPICCDTVGYLSECERQENLCLDELSDDEVDGEDAQPDDDAVYELEPGVM